VGTTAGD
jgi:hypothetical protein